MRRKFSVLLFIIMYAVGLIFTPAAQARVDGSKKILPHYMPWFKSQPVSGSWGSHWGAGIFNPNTILGSNGYRDVASHYYPLIEPYDSSDTYLHEYHVGLMKMAGVDGAIIDWYGTSSHLDYPDIRANTDQIAGRLEKAGLKMMIMYEDRTIDRLINDAVITPAQAIPQAQADMQFIETNYMIRTNYFMPDNTPMFGNFGPLYFTNGADWVTILSAFSNSVSFLWQDDQVSPAVGAFAWPPMYLSGGGTVSVSQLNSYLDTFETGAVNWTYGMAGAFPRFDDIYEEAGTGSSYGDLLDDNGATFSNTLVRALTNDMSFVQIATWNDFGEGTIIEPTMEYGFSHLEAIQEAKREYIDPAFPYDLDDLTLPYQIYNLRTNNAGNAALYYALDLMYTNMIQGDVDRAHVQADAVSLATGTTAFALMDVYPDHNNTNIPTDTTEITLIFSKRFDSSTSAGITISGPGVTGLSYVTGNNEWMATFDILGSLQDHSTYTVTIPSSVATTEGGGTLGSNSVYQFTTTGTPEIGIPTFGTPSPPEVVLIDFGNDNSYRGTNVISPDQKGDYWNSIWSGAYYANMVDRSNNTTTLDLGFDSVTGTDSFNGPGGIYNEADLGFLGTTNAVNDYYVNSSFQIQGLDPNRTYDLFFFGSHKFSANDETRYEVYSDSAYSNLIASATVQVQQPTEPWKHNTNLLAAITDLATPAGNIFYIKFQGTNGANGYLNAMQIDAYDPQAVVAALYTTGRACEAASSVFTVTNKGTGSLVYEFHLQNDWMSSPDEGQVFTNTAGQGRTHTLNLGHDEELCDLGQNNGVIAIYSANSANGNQFIPVAHIVQPSTNTSQLQIDNDAAELNILQVGGGNANTLVLYKEGSVPSSTPTNCGFFTEGDTVGDGTVVYFGPDGQFEHEVASGTSHYYVAFAAACDLVFGPGRTTMVSSLDLSAPPIYEPFAYTNGSVLNGESGGAGWTNAWSQGFNFTIRSNTFASVPQQGFITGDSTGDAAFRGIPTFNSGSIYVSFQFRYATNFWSGLSLYDGPTEELFIGETGLGTDAFGVGAQSMGNATLSPGEDYTLVARYDFGANMYYGWLYTNTTQTPLPAAEPGTSDVSGSDASIARINRIRLAGGAAAGSHEFDEIRIGSSWEEILPNNPINTTNYLLESGAFCETVNTSFTVSNASPVTLVYEFAVNDPWLSSADEGLVFTNLAGAAQAHPLVLTHTNGTCQDGVVTGSVTITSDNPQYGNELLVVEQTLTQPAAEPLYSLQNIGSTLNRLDVTPVSSPNVLVVYKEGSAPSGVPANCSIYAAGDTLGDGQVVYFGPAGTFDHEVSADSSHYYAFFNNPCGLFYAGGTTGIVSSAYMDPAPVYEPFNYTNGTALNNRNGGMGWTNAWVFGALFDVVTNGMVSPNNALPQEGNLVRNDSGDAAFRGFAPYSTGRVYASVQFRYSSNGWAGLSLFEGDTERFFIGESPAGAFDLSIGGVSLGTNSLPAGQDYTLVLMYDFDNDMFYGHAYTNATGFLPSSEPGTWLVSGANSSVGLIDRVRLAGTSSAGPHWFDEIRVASTWSDLRADPTVSGSSTLAASGAFCETVNTSIQFTNTTGSSLVYQLQVHDDFMTSADNGLVFTSTPAQVRTHPITLVHTSFFCQAGTYTGTVIFYNTALPSNSEQVDVEYTVTSPTNVPSLMLNNLGSQLNEINIGTGGGENVLVIYREGAAPTAGPMDCTTYAVDDAIGGGVVVYLGPGGGFQHQVDFGTSHYYTAYANPCGGGYGGGVTSFVTTGTYDPGYIYEPGNLTNGAVLNGLFDGNGFTSTWQQGYGFSVVPGTFTQPGLAPVPEGNALRNNGGDSAFRYFGSLSNAVLYTSFNFRYASNGWAGLSLAEDGTNRLFVGESSVGSNAFQVGGVTLGTDTLTPGVDYTLVAKFNMGSLFYYGMVITNATGSLPLNEPGTWDITGFFTSPVSKINGIRLAGSPEAGINDYDEIRVGFSWDQLVQPYAAAVTNVITASGQVCETVISGFTVTNSTGSDRIYRVEVQDDWISTVDNGQVFTNAPGGWTAHTMDLSHTSQFCFAGTYTGSIVVLDLGDPNASELVSVEYTVNAATNLAGIQAGVLGAELLKIDVTGNGSPGVLVVYREGTPPNAGPTNCSAYTAGDPLGGGTIIYAGPDGTFDFQVAEGMDHHFEIFPVLCGDFYGPGTTMFIPGAAYDPASVYEPFNLTNGVILNGQADGLGWTSAWSQGFAFDVVTNLFIAPGGNGPGHQGRVIRNDQGDSAFRGFTPISTGSLFLSFQFRYQSNGWAGLTLMDGTSDWFYVGESSVGTNSFQVGGAALGDNTLAPDTDFTLAARLDLASGGFYGEIFTNTMDSLPGSEPLTWDIQGVLTSAVPQLNRIRLAGSATAGANDFDEIRIAQSWGSMVENPGLDADADGILDAWELEYFGFLSIITPTSNSDADSLTDLEEWIIDSAPNSSNDTLVQQGFVLQTGSDKVTLGNTKATRMYAVDYSTNTLDGTWFNLVPAVQGSNGVTTVDDPGTSGRRYYRGRVMKP